MKASEFIRESEELDEYQLVHQNDPSWLFRVGNMHGKQKPIQTPLTDYTVRYITAGNFHQYFLYDKSSNDCIGHFVIEEKTVGRPIKRLLAPGIQAVTPHMSLAPDAQRKGISTLAYSTFLQGGPWVFVTKAHTAGASKLWDSLVKGDIVSFYVNEQGKIVSSPDDESYRLLGPRSRFKST